MAPVFYSCAPIFSVNIVIYGDTGCEKRKVERTDEAPSTEGYFEPTHHPRRSTGIWIAHNTLLRLPSLYTGHGLILKRRLILIQPAHLPPGQALTGSVMTLICCSAAIPPVATATGDPKPTLANTAVFGAAAIHGDPAAQG